VDAWGGAILQKIRNDWRQASSSAVEVEFPPPSRKDETMRTLIDRPLILLCLMRGQVGLGRPARGQQQSRRRRRRQLPQDDVESAVRLVQSRIDLDLSALLEIRSSRG
jgi:hypothetical protein